MRILSTLLLMIFLSNASAVTLKVLEWEGYISPFKADFEAYAKQQGVDVSLEIMKPYLTNPEQLFEIARNKQADIVTPTNNYFKMRTELLLKLLHPLDTTKLTNYSKIHAPLVNADYDKSAGSKFSVPLLGGSYGLFYNANKVSAPTSWEVLWQPENKGTFEVTNDQFEANIYTTMLLLGYQPNTVYDIAKSNVDKEKLQQKVNELVKNAKGFWGGDASVDNMKTLNYVTSYWFSIATANKAGQNWKPANVKEGVTVWLDGISIAKHVGDDADKLKAAYLLLDFMISTATQKKLYELYGSVMINSEVNKDTTFFKPEYLWQPLDDRTRNIYKMIWETALKNK